MRTVPTRRTAVGIASGAALAVATLATPAIAGPAPAPSAHHTQSKAPKPTVTKVDNHGNPTGQTQGNAGIIVRGTGFHAVTKVTFGGVAGKHLKVLSPTKLRVDAPQHAAGQVDVRVVTHAGTSKVSKHDLYAYQVYLRLSAGNYYSCQIVGGTDAVRCWGGNDLGQLGIGSTGGTRLTAVRVSGLSHVVSISAGGWHACVLLANGKVKCWGNNQSGQLGNGDAVTPSYNTPQTVVGLGKPAVAIGAGYYSSCAVLVDGTARCWGYGADGALGNGHLTPEVALPVKVKNLKGATDIDVGYEHACATKSNGTEWCWGYNANHDLGDGTTTTSDVPVQVVGVRGAVSTSTQYQTTCALTRSHTAQCWGLNDFGQLGNRTTTGASRAVTVQGLHGVAKVSAGGRHTCAIVSGKVLCWGANGSGQLGNNTTVNQLVPSAAQGITKATGLALGDLHTLTVTHNKATFAWGLNSSGQLGNGTTTLSKVPVPVT